MESFSKIFTILLFINIASLNQLYSQNKETAPQKDKFLSSIKILPDDYNNKIKIINIDINKFPEISLILNLPQEYVEDVEYGKLFLLQNGKKQRISSIEPISEQNNVPIDFVFVLDKTGSMSEAISSIKRNIKNFTSNILNKGIDYQFALVIFSDTIDGVFPFTPNIDKFLSYINPISARGGGDTLENSLEALGKAYHLDFRESSKKIVILITDALFQSRGVRGDGSTDFILQDIIEMSMTNNITSYCVVPEYFKEYDSLSLFTGGKSYNITSSFNSILDNLGYEVTKYFALKYQYKDSVLPDNITFSMVNNETKDTLINQKTKIIDINKKIRFDSKILFDFNKSELKNEFCVELDRLIKLMKMRPGLEIIVNGHSDDIGTEEYNYSLSRDRAASVKAYLVQNGINTHRITTKGFGKTQPISPNDSEEGRQLNRRIEIVIIKK